MTHSTIKEHILELKRRVTFTLTFFLLAFIACYYFSDEIFNIMLDPLLSDADLAPKNMIFTSLTEPFFTYLHLAATTAMIYSIPFALWQFYIFIRPALHKSEQHIALLIICCFIILASGGICFAYFFVIPKAWAFFLQYQYTDTTLPLVLQARISEYVLLMLNLIFAFALAFQLPNILILLTLIGFLSSKSLQKSRRVAIVIIFAAAAVLTPPDIFSQIALALPMILLYEISIIICHKIEKRRNHA